MGEECLPQKNVVHKSLRRLRKYLILVPNQGVLISWNQIQTPKGIKVKAANQAIHQQPNYILLTQKKFQKPHRYLWMLEAYLSISGLWVLSLPDISTAKTTPQESSPHFCNVIVQTGCQYLTNCSRLYSSRLPHIRDFVPCNTLPLINNVKYFKIGFFENHTPIFAYALPCISGNLARGKMEGLLSALVMKESNFMTLKKKG